MTTIEKLLREWPSCLIGLGLPLAMVSACIALVGAAGGGGPIEAVGGVGFGVGCSLMAVGMGAGIVRAAVEDEP